MKKYVFFSLFIAFGLTSCSIKSSGSENKNLNAGTIEHLLLDLESEFNKVEIDYINCYENLGMGVVNPKDFAFTLILDTVKLSEINIDIEQQEYIIPILYKPSYQIFYMIVNNDVGRYYEVRLNSLDVGYIAKEDVNFYSWSTLISNVKGVIGREGFLEKHTDSASRTFTDDDIFSVLKIEGEWIYVELENEGNTTKEKDRYWMKWKNNNKLNVIPVLLE